jgi:type VI secretion system secreted protein VgrG
MPITQEGRLLDILTPLGKDFLLMSSFHGSEGLSTLFQYEVELLHEDAESGIAPTVVDVKQVLGNPVVIRISQRDGTTRYIHGIINSFIQGNRTERFTHYKATIVPPLWLTTQRRQSRIFQQKTVPDIIREVLSGLDFSFELQGKYEQREYCVQYRETDFNFVSRLMEEEGIYYYFEHTNSNMKMIIADTPQSHRDCPTKNEIAFSRDVTSQEYFVSSIKDWLVNQNYQTGKYTLWDHNFQLPHRQLEAQKTARTPISKNDILEIYDYPGGYAKRFDGIEKSGGEQASNLQKIFEDNTRTVEIRMQEIDARQTFIQGLSDCASLTAGHRFKLTGHPHSANNDTYIVTALELSAIQSPSYESGEEAEKALENSFTCIPTGSGKAPFRPPSITPKPVVQGSQTALVVGPSGEKIFVDKYGRVKVQFHWDRQSKADQNSSCWIRVAQNLAGTKWGAIYFPRIGQEVIVDFLEGDPDRPLIVGSVYNAKEMPPYTLPDEKTKTVLFKSDNFGGGFNEIRIEDKAGKEQIFIHAERNQDVRVKNDHLESIGRSTHLTVAKDQLEKIGGDKHLEVIGDENRKIGGTISLNVTSDSQNKVGMKYALNAGTEIHLKSGMNLVIESGTTLTMKVGGNFININPGGIFIKGTMVFINSGGAAGSGAGASPGAPTAPTAADTAQGGRQAQVPVTRNVTVTAYSQLSLTLVHAAQSGVPFCDI